MKIDLDEIDEWLNRDGGSERDAPQVIQGPELSAMIRELRAARELAHSIKRWRDGLSADVMGHLAKYESARDGD